MLGEINRLQQISSYYDVEAQVYDAGYSDAVCLAENSIVTEILTSVVHGKVLDVGCGSGFLHEIMEIPDYVGIELSPKMTKEAKKKFSDESFLIGDMHALPYANESFDTVVSLFGPISYSLTPEELMKEFNRVLKPGGTIAVMPYTLRVGHKIDVGEYSTAIEDSIQKIYYTESMLREVTSCFSDVNVLGINYFLNTFDSYISKMGYGMLADQTLFVSFMQQEAVFRHTIPAEFARHMIAIGKKNNKE